MKKSDKTLIAIISCMILLYCIFVNPTLTLFIIIMILLSTIKNRNSFMIKEKIKYFLTYLIGIFIQLIVTPIVFVIGLMCVAIGLIICIFGIAVSITIGSIYGIYKIFNNDKVEYENIN